VILCYWAGQLRALREPCGDCARLLYCANSVSVVVSVGLGAGCVLVRQPARPGKGSRGKHRRLRLAAQLCPVLQRLGMPYQGCALAT
jgi:hypothetical protein